jgi:hypothetical protein
MTDLKPFTDPHTCENHQLVAAGRFGTTFNLSVSTTCLHPRLRSQSLVGRTHDGGMACCLFPHIHELVGGLIPTSPPCVVQGANLRCKQPKKRSVHVWSCVSGGLSENTLQRTPKLALHSVDAGVVASTLLHLSARFVVNRDVHTVRQQKLECDSGGVNRTTSRGRSLTWPTVFRGMHEQQIGRRRGIIKTYVVLFLKALALVRQGFSGVLTFGSSSYWDH